MPGKQPHTVMQPVECQATFIFSTFIIQTTHAVKLSKNCVALQMTIGHIGTYQKKLPYTAQPKTMYGHVNFVFALLAKAKFHYKNP